MLKIKLLHPDILSALGRLGHGSRILIADGNFAFQTRSPMSALRVYLNLMPGVVRVREVLLSLREVIPIESAMVMTGPDDLQKDFLSELETDLPGMEIQRVERQVFYREVLSEHTGLIIATGETRRFANLLLTIGVVKEA